MSIETQYRPYGSYIEWGTIFAGTVLACAIAAVLVQFGAAVGMTQISMDLSADANITPQLVLGTGIWLLWVQLLSSLAGSYLAGRMRMPIMGATEHERDMRDGVHGLLVWALSTLAVIAGSALLASIAALADNPVEDVVRTADVQRMQDNIAVIFTFFAASTSLVTAAVSWWAATVGGDHRDTSADHTRYFTFRAAR